MGIKYSKEQLSVIQNIKNNLLVLSPAGSGKTLVISKRIQNIIDNNIDEEKILSLTFTNRAANEMEKRIKKDINTNKLIIKTFHGFCHYLIKKEIDNLDIQDNFVVYDEQDCFYIIEEILKSIIDLKKLHINREYFIKDIHNSLQKSKEEIAMFDDCDISEIFYNFINKKNLDIIKNSNVFLDFNQILFEYQNILKKNNAFDFSDLVINTYNLLKNKNILKKWQEKYLYINVDEVQDTNVIEFEIIRKIGKNAIVSFYGDINQTIYEWRGSNPKKIIEEFKNNFDDVLEIKFEKNYRANKDLIDASKDFINAYDQNKNLFIENLSHIDNHIICHEARNLDCEARWIYKEILKLTKKGVNLNEIGILSRNNKINKNISLVFQKQSVADKNQKIKTYLVDEQKFFRIKEIKDLMAYLKILLNEKDEISFERVLLEVFKEDKEKIEFIKNNAKASNMKLCDFLNDDIYNKDIFRDLLEYYKNKEIVVFDVESTGLDVLNDEVIEIAAIKFNKDKEISRFQRFIKNKNPVLESFYIHGYSDEFLKEKGSLKEVVFKEFNNYTKDCILLGHNVSYDINILNNNMNKVNMNFDNYINYFDTLDISKRYIKSTDYKLETLSNLLKINHKPTHNAMDDIIATKMIFESLVKDIEKGRKKREDFINSFLLDFEIIRMKINEIREKSKKLRPYELLHEILKQNKIIELLEKKNNQKKIEYLRELYMIFKNLDDIDLEPIKSLENILNIISLSNDVERYISNQKKIPIITIHQSKGLEFKYVFIASCNEYDFPSYFSIKQNNLKEEHRLFYVAMTRAKEKLYISYNMFNENDRQKQKSRFIDYIPNKYKKYV
ncbi:MAG: UvrD-helicase domain-containing protein [Peptostreptococcaceae bacterium]|jgi:DNA helicase-2/ATP-dependent DNA helicase PcrA|nr:UvrD-helicase domain-containing protein [Peptostreptococcaceae bacterium]